MPELVTIPNVPICETGVDWPASTGPVTFTSDDLVSAANAPVSDAAIKLPRMRFGHTAAGTNMSDSAGGFQEQPCVGKFCNMRVEQEGNLLVADLVGVPKWLAAVLPSAYPNRSVEAFFDVTTGTGRQHRMVITSVALLGENLPGVQTLDDLEYLFSDEPTEWIEALTAKTTVMAQHEGGDSTMPKHIAASVDSGDVRCAFYDQIAVGDRYYWWLHQMFVDPQAVVAEDESGEYWYVSYSVEGNTVTFGDPVQVFIQWVETEGGAVAASSSKLPSFGKPEQTFASAVESRPADRQAEINKKEASANVPKTKINLEALRKRANLSEEQLPDDATEEQINEALSAEPEEPDTDEDESDEDETEEGDDETVVENDNKDAVTVDASAYKAMQARLAALEKKEDGREKVAQLSEVDQAIKDRKIPPSRKAHYLSLMTRDPKGTKEFLNKLEKDAVPGGEIGTSRSNEDASGRPMGTGLLPELAGKEA